MGLNGSAKFSNLVANGWNYENDELRVLNAANCYSAAKYMYLTKEEAVEIFEDADALAGWYDADEASYVGDQTFDLGSGFLTSIASSAVTFTYAGQVFDQAFSISCAGMKYAIIPNALPRSVKMSEISATGWNYENDELRVLNPTNCQSAKKLMYLTKEEAVEIFEDADALAGWYDADEANYEGDFEVSSGDGFMTSLASPSIIINMPKAIK